MRNRQKEKKKVASDQACAGSIAGGREKRREKRAKID